MPLACLKSFSSSYCPQGSIWTLGHGTQRPCLPVLSFSQSPMPETHTDTMCFTSPSWESRFHSLHSSASVDLPPALYLALSYSFFKSDPGCHVLLAVFGLCCHSNPYLSLRALATLYCNCLFNYFANWTISYLRARIIFVHTHIPATSHSGLHIKGTQTIAWRHFHPSTLLFVSFFQGRLAADADLHKSNVEVYL